MLWFKRNLPWALAILAAAVLTVAGGYYIWRGRAQNEDLALKLGAARSELNRLTTDVKPSPTPENVRAAREDVKKSQEYSALVRRFFVPTPYTPLNSQTYRSMLETNLAALRRQAALSGVELTTNYAFSFGPQTKQMTFEPASLKPLSEQLVEISEVCRALFNARIHRLEHVRRVTVSQYDSSSASEVLPGIQVMTNRFTGLWAWPYEFSFECFSAELAAALEELSRIPRMLLIKTILVEPSGSATQPSMFVPSPTLEPPPRPGIPPGRRGFVPGSGAPQPGAPAPKPAALSTVLEEGLLRVVIQVQVIKPAR